MVLDSSAGYSRLGFSNQNSFFGWLLQTMRKKILACYFALVYFLHIENFCFNISTLSRFQCSSFFSYYASHIETCVNDVKAECCLGAVILITVVNVWS